MSHTLSCGKLEVKQTGVYSAVHRYVRQRIIRRERVVCAGRQVHVTGVQAVIDEQAATIPVLIEEIRT